MCIIFKLRMIFFRKFFSAFHLIRLIIKHDKSVFFFKINVDNPLH